MSFQAISLCKHPVTVLLIDDNKEHLELYRDILTANDINCIAISEPKKALELINKLDTSDFWLRISSTMSHDTNEVDKDQTKQHSAVRLTELKKLWHITNSFDRFNDIGIVCIDKQMPEMSGIDLLHQQSNRSAKIIMFTGFHDTTDVIKLMQENLIDGYIQKHADDAKTQLIKTIQQQTNRYFSIENSFAEKLIPGISKVLSNKAFCELHNYIQKKYNIVEYYTIDNSPSFLMLDGYGKGIILGIIHQDELEAFDYLIKHSDTPVLDDITKAIQERKKAPYFLHSDRMKLLPHELGEFLVDIKHIPNTTFYYTIIDDVQKYGFNLSAVKSYNRFLQEYNDY